MGTRSVPLSHYQPVIDPQVPKEKSSLEIMSFEYLLLSFSLSANRHAFIVAWQANIDNQSHQDQHNNTRTAYFG